MTRSCLSPVWLAIACVTAALLAALGASGKPRASGAAAPTPMAKAREAPGAPRAPAGPSEVLLPPQQLPLKFNHARHDKLGTSCLYCHSQATTSRSSADRLLPPPSRCDACHGTDHDRASSVAPGVDGAATCSYCHEGHRPEDGARVARVKIPRPHVKFDHAVHAARGIACPTCHASVATGGLATRADLPRMQLCLRCHGAPAGSPLAARGACEVCHETVAGARLRTDFDSGRLLPPAWMGGAEHGADWIARHKIVAGANSALCATCHTESECVDCHDGRVRPRKIHPGDWLGMHAEAARMGNPECTSCHQAQSFCQGCHARAGVTLSGPEGNLGARGRFHPPQAVWSDSPRSPRHHAWEAERNLTTCVSCHGERDCALCHASPARGGLGGISPHPPGFGGAECRTALSRNPRPCLFCHDPGSGELSRCR